MVRRVPSLTLPPAGCIAHSALRGTDGNLYIANETSNEVLRYDGSTMSVFVAAGSGGLAAAPQCTFWSRRKPLRFRRDFGSVLRYDGTSGAFMGSFATTGLGSGPLWMQFGPDGLLYVTVRTTTTSLDTTLFSSFSLNSGNKDAKDIVTDGVHLWVVNDSTDRQGLQVHALRFARRKLDDHFRRRQSRRASRSTRRT